MTVTVVDATLREGEQAPGVALSVEEKLLLAELLVDAGVALLDAGMPSASLDEARFFQEAIQRFGAHRVGASIRATSEDAAAAVAAGARRFFVITPVSALHIERKLGLTRPAFQGRVVDLVQSLVGSGGAAWLAAEDASRTPVQDAIDFLVPAIRAGARGAFACDTVGVWRPSAAAAWVRALAAGLPPDAEVGMHCHDDHGLALANTLAGLEAGATLASVTVNGIGERCGNADLAAFAVAAEDLYGRATGVHRDHLLALSRRVEALSGIPVHPQAPLVGDHAFTHTSGVHVDGFRKDPRTYEGPDPGRLGRQHRAALSPRSGRSALPGASRDPAARDAAFAACRARRDAFVSTWDAWRVSLPLAPE